MYYPDPDNHKIMDVNAVNALGEHHKKFMNDLIVKINQDNMFPQFSFILPYYRTDDFTALANNTTYYSIQSVLDAYLQGFFDSRETPIPQFTLVWSGPITQSSAIKKSDIDTYKDYIKKYTSN